MKQRCAGLSKITWLALFTLHAWHQPGAGSLRFQLKTRTPRCRRPSGLDTTGQRSRSAAFVEPAFLPPLALACVLLQKLVYGFCSFMTSRILDFLDVSLVDNLT
ncbi:hypothetical protein E2C01_008110 [Portunus trituberculatus]|uniref:Secreted protein n=1 Tax=Portunus trituberculatus TaxID=210409 RepID=A0A5B7D558_PORTR|nr:hypothetical protein [Portunus trituberculatus]